MSKLGELVNGLITYELALNELDELKRVYGIRRNLCDIVNVSGDILFDAMMRLNLLAAQVITVPYLDTQPAQAVGIMAALEFLKGGYHILTKTGIPKRLAGLEDLTDNKS